jgi:N-acyl-D-amino-acid deacylase
MLPASIGENVMKRWILDNFLLIVGTVLVGCGGKPELDLVIRGGNVLDGTGAPAIRADIGIRGDRVVAIGDLSGRSAGRTLDAAGRVVAPGFIDAQGQSGVTLLVDGRGESHIRQGITTEIIGEGSTPALWTIETADPETVARYQLDVDWTSFGGYLRALESRGTSINVGSLVPATMVRREVVGDDDRDPTPEELSRMEAIVDHAMTEGAFGLSSALIYPPGAYAKTEELVALAKVAARHGGIYISHVRGESFRVKEAIGEAISIGEQAGLPVVIYHLKVAAKPYWGTMGEIGDLIELARAKGAKVSACQYPYTAGGTSLIACLPAWAQDGGREKALERLKDPAMRARIRHEVETTIDGWENLIAGSGFEGIQLASLSPEMDSSLLGKRITEIAAERGEDPWDTFFWLLTESGGRIGALYHMMSEDDVRTAMKFPWVSVGTDSAALAPEGELGHGQPHPRTYGTFPRILGHYVRDENVLALPEAVRKMTSLAADQFGIQERGRLKEGYFADVVVFDPESVIDRATYADPKQFSTGIETVIVNGVVTVENGEHTGAKAGRALYGPGVATR